MRFKRPAENAAKAQTVWIGLPARHTTRSPWPFNVSRCDNCLQWLKSGEGTWLRKTKRLLQTRTPPHLQRRW